MNKFKVGDTIEYTLENNHRGSLRGKTFTAKIYSVSKYCYVVYAEYGQDFIPFDRAKKVK